MSNVLKKITKKYKWLRFLNYKTTKLAVLSAALFGLCLSSGASFAKYRDENYGGGNAGAARFGSAFVKYDYELVRTPSTLDPDSDAGYYVFMAEFRVEFGESEVKRNFSMSIKLGDAASSNFENSNSAAKTSFTLPNTVSNTTLPTFITKTVDSVSQGHKVENALNIDSDIFNNDNSNRAKWDNLKSSLSLTSFSSNMFYYAWSINNPNSYNWETYQFPSSSSLNTSILNFIDNGKLLHSTSDILNLNLDATTYYFKIVFFSNLTKGTSGGKTVLNTEESKIFTKLSVFQLDSVA